jgi:hypothetical protein
MKKGELKYVITDINGFEEIIIFSKSIEHSTFGHMKPKTAGFINMSTGECYGLSDSLGIISNPEDDTMVAKMYMGI